jgi:quercetin dioxygenase-like cupin family protein
MPFLDLQDLEERQLGPGFRGQFVHSDHMTFAYWNIEANAALPEHSHPHEKVASVLSGEFELNVDGETKTLGPGSVAIIPSGVRHSGKAVTTCRIIDVFYPVREDYR